MTLTAETHTRIDGSDLDLGLYLTFAVEREFTYPDRSVGEDGGWAVSATLKAAQFAGTTLRLDMLCASMGPGWQADVERTERDRWLANLADDEADRTGADARGEGRWLEAAE